MIDTENYNYTPGYCLYTMREVMYVTRRNVMGDLIGCPACHGPINDIYGTPSEGMHLFRPNPKLVAILETYKQLQHIGEPSAPKKYPDEIPIKGIEIQ